jgi:hypothetical protein
LCGVTSSFGYAIGQRHRHGNGIQTEREKLTECDRQVITHLEQAQNLEGTLTEYAAAYGLDVKDLTSGSTMTSPPTTEMNPLLLAFPKPPFATVSKG